MKDNIIFHHLLAYAILVILLLLLFAIWAQVFF